MRVWHTDSDFIALTVGPVVVTGKYFRVLSPSERQAVLAHEHGHIYYWHALKRIWWILTFQWSGIREKCHAQEYEADRYATIKGHGDGLLEFLTRVKSHENPLHPTPEHRMERIRKWIERITGPMELDPLGDSNGIP